MSETEEDRAALIRIIELLDLEDAKRLVDDVQWSNWMRLDNVGESTTCVPCM